MRPGSELQTQSVIPTRLISRCVLKSTLKSYMAAMLLSLLPMTTANYARALTFALIVANTILTASAKGGKSKLDSELRRGLGGNAAEQLDVIVRAVPGGHAA